MSAAANTVLAFIGNLALAAGAGLVGYAQLRTGAIVRTILDKLREYPSNADYGGVDGQDSTLALQRALNSNAVV